MKKCIVFFVILIAMLALAIITGYNEPANIETDALVENNPSHSINLESHSK